MQDIIRVMMAPGPKSADHKQQRNSDDSGSGVMVDRIEALKTRRAATAMRDHLRQSSPQLAAVLVDERDDVRPVDTLLLLAHR
jgi:pheromone shutdown protein TraB